ncbi:MAG: carbohydrate-binding protein, partial [Clostridia bacterium]|nr:carbohydrate-binding protein [Clostridia bacterium]
MQPRVGINLENSYKTIFTEIFAGSGGVDPYTNAISDTYHDNFGEGIYTGKGIYDLKVFNLVMKGKIPENTVLSHDLLEGSYLRCGLASDIMLLDGYPKSYSSFLTRLSRWIRGDYQILGYLSSKSNLSKLSKYKILDNIRRSMLEITAILNITALILLKMFANVKVGFGIFLMLLSIVIPSVLELLGYIIFKKENIKKQKTFTKTIDGLKGSLYRALINIITLPTKAYISINAIVRTVYRMTVSKEHLLEWTTSEEAEKQDKNSVFSVYKKMLANVILGVIFLGLNLFATCSICFKVFV